MDNKLDELYNYIKNEENETINFIHQVKLLDIKGVYLYGAGAACVWYIDFLVSNGITIYGVIDRERHEVINHQNMKMETISFEEFIKEKDLVRAHVVISALKYREEIEQVLQKILPKDNIWCFECELYQNKMISDLNKYREILVEHKKEIEDCYKQYEDEISRQTLINIVKGRVSGCIKYFSKVRDSHIGLSEELVNINNGDVVFDCGSYTGDSLAVLQRMLKRNEKAQVYCFEPDEAMFEVLKENAIKIKELDTVIIKKGVSNHSGYAFFNNQSDGISSIVEAEKEAKTCIEMCCLDEYSDNKVSLIKMDIEGNEMAALAGAKVIIKKDRPQLAISIYHRPEDLWEIQQYIHKIVPEYKFYLRHHNYAGPDTLLYALI